MSVDQISTAQAEVPPGVLARHRSILFYPAHIPDLIGVKDRTYLDRSGLQRHRSIVPKAHCHRIICIPGSAGIPACLSSMESLILAALFGLVETSHFVRRQIKRLTAEPNH